MMKNAMTKPELFRDGRARKFWIVFNMDLDGPFDSEADAQPTMDRYNAEYEASERNLPVTTADAF